MRCSTEPSRESVPIGMVSTSSITCLHNKIARMILERAEREREASKLHTYAEKRHHFIIF